MGISFDPSFFLYEVTVAIQYIPIVMLMSVVPLIAGLLLGTPLALSRVYQTRVMSGIARGYIVVTRSIPILLMMFLVYYGVRGMYEWMGLRLSLINKVVVALIALTLPAAGSLSEGIRASLTSIEKGQYEAADSVGMTRPQALTRVILPQCLPVAVPIIGGAFISIVKGSSAAFLMGVVEMIQGTNMKTAGNYKYLEAYCAVAAVYWALTIVIERATHIAEKRAGSRVRMGVGV